MITTEWNLGKYYTKGSLIRKREAFNVAKRRAIRMSQDSGWCSGVYGVDKEGKYVRKTDATFIRFKRYWRGQRSQCIKKDCNRRLRRSPKLKNQQFTRQRGLYRRLTEFWWEYD